MMMQTCVDCTAIASKMDALGVPAAFLQDMTALVEPAESNGEKTRTNSATMMQVCV
jgi:hypothetical protein